MLAAAGTRLFSVAIVLLGASAIATARAAPNAPVTDAAETISTIAQVLAVIMAGDASEVQIAGFLIALRVKGEAEDERAGRGQGRDTDDAALAAVVALGRGVGGGGGVGAHDVSRSFA